MPYIHEMERTEEYMATVERVIAFGIRRINNEPDAKRHPRKEFDWGCCGGMSRSSYHSYDPYHLVNQVFKIELPTYDVQLGLRIYERSRMYLRRPMTAPELMKMIKIVLIWRATISMDPFYIHAAAWSWPDEDVLKEWMESVIGETDG